MDARWVHERGPEMATPPTPPDIHAIQTYFFDPDGKEWIATVLAPRGRELAAQWHGAYKVPDRVEAASTGVKKSSPAPLFAVVLVLLIVGGGAAAVVAGTQGSPSASASVAPTSAPGATANPGATVAVSAEPTATAVGETPSPTQVPGGTTRPNVTQPPVRTPAPTVAPPVGTSLALADGSVVTYSGPARVNIGVPFTVTFTVRSANNTPGTGTFLVSFGNTSTGGSKTSSGTLDPNGRITMNMSGAALPGNYPFVVNYKGQQGQVAILRVG